MLIPLGLLTKEQLHVGPSMGTEQDVLVEEVSRLSQDGPAGVGGSVFLHPNQGADGHDYTGPNGLLGTLTGALGQGQPALQGLRYEVSYDHQPVP
jgi:hypothetical protein